MRARREKCWNHLHQAENKINLSLHPRVKKLWLNSREKTLYSHIFQPFHRQELNFSKLRKCHNDEHDNDDPQDEKGFFISNFPLDSIHLKTWLWNELEQTSNQTALKMAKKIAIEKLKNFSQRSVRMNFSSHKKDDWVARKKNSHSFSVFQLFSNSILRVQFPTRVDPSKRNKLSNSFSSQNKLVSVVWRWWTGRLRTLRIPEEQSVCLMKIDRFLSILEWNIGWVHEKRNWKYFSVHASITVAQTQSIKKLLHRQRKK